MRREKQKRDEQKYESDLSKFNTQLRKYGLKLKEMGSDGNCMFRALSDQLKGGENHHGVYRQQCADYIEQNKELYKFFIEDDEDIDDYIAWIRQDSRWGGQLEMNALA